MPVRMIPYEFPRRSLEEMKTRAAVVLAEMKTRRSCRYFSDDPPPRDLIEMLIAVGYPAPDVSVRPTLYRSPPPGLHTPAQTGVRTGE